MKSIAEAKKNILEVIGNTPLLKLGQIAKGMESEIYVKLDYLNPGGSTKDRIGKYIMERALAEGKIKAGGTIIEATSGNTGVGLAMFASQHQMKCIFVMADKQSQEKINNLRAFGAQVVVCPSNVAPEDPRSYYSVAERLAQTVPNSYYVNQYANLWNRETHYQTTGPELFEQTSGGDFDAFVVAVGTGGTISGVGAYFKEVRPQVKIIGVDCEGSIIEEYWRTGKMGIARPYVLEGMGEDFIPENYNFKVIDGFEVVGDKESFLMARRLLKEEGIYCGGSAGGAVVGAIRYATKLKTPERIIALACDSGNRYTSKIFNDEWMRVNGYLESSFNVQIKDLAKLLRKEPRSIVSLETKSTIAEAVKLMEEYGISQIPVTEKGRVQGIVEEKSILMPLFRGDLSLNDNVTVALNPSFLEVSPSEQLSKVTNALLEKKTVVVVEKDQIVDVLTDIDILQYISLSNGT